MLEKYKNELNRLTVSTKPSVVTAVRGRVISKIKNEINELKKDEEKNKEKITILVDYLYEVIYDHKNHLSSRYNQEFIRGKATVKGIFTVLPAGVKIAIEKVKSSMNELKEAKFNKEKINGIMNVLKNLGLTAVTPGIFTAKFIAKHCYLLLLLLPQLKLLIKDNGKVSNNETQVQEKVTEYSESQIKEAMESLKGIKDPILDKLKEVEDHVTEQGKRVGNVFTFEPKETMPSKEAIDTAIKSLQDVKDPMLDKLNEIKDHLVKQGQSITNSFTFEAKQPESIVNVDSIGLETIPEDKAMVNMLYDIVKFMFKTQVPGAELYNLYNTKEDAIISLMNQGLEEDEALDLVNNNSHIRWLVGEGQLFSSEKDMIESLQNDEMFGISLKGKTVEEYLHANPGLVQLIEQQNAGIDINALLSKLGPMAISAALMLLASYGIPIPENVQSFVFK